MKPSNGALHRKSGQTIVPVLMSALLIGIVAASLPSILNYLNTQQRMTRVKMQMNQVANRVRLIVGDSSSYNMTSPQCVADSSKCPLKNIVKNWLLTPPFSQIPRFYPKVVGARCNLTKFPSGICGIRVIPNLIVDGEPKILEVVYEGEEVKIKSILITVESPSKSITNSLNCDDGEVMTGITSSGTAACKEVVKGCGQGEIFVPIDSGLGLCKPIHDGQVGCNTQDAVIKSIGGWSDDLKPEPIDCSVGRIIPGVE